MNVILPAPPPIIDEATFRVNQALENVSIPFLDPLIPCSPPSPRLQTQRNLTTLSQGEDLGQIQTQDQYFALIGRAVKKWVYSFKKCAAFLNGGIAL